MPDANAPAKSNGCRIGRIRHKATGQDIRVIPQAKRDATGAEMVRRASRIVDQCPEGVAGYFVVALGKDGRYSATYDCNGVPAGGNVFGALVMEVLRREIFTNPEIQWFCKQQGWIG